MKLKLCAGCEQQRVIWKNDNGLRYCLSCWNSKTKGQKKTPSPGVRIRPVSKKKEVDNQVYAVLRRQFLQRPENLTCHGKLQGCTGSAEELTIHHKKGRGSYFLNTQTWIPLCQSCHRWVTDHSKEAEALGLSDSRLTPHPDNDEE